MRVCCLCRESKLESEFSKKSSRKDGLQPQCKHCSNAVSRAYHNGPNHQRHIDQITIRKAKVIAASKQWLINYLESHPCVDCGYTDVRALDFDHVRGEKVRNITDMLGRGCSIRTLAKEILKCEVRCANCHRIVTNERGKFYRSVAYRVSLVEEP